MHQVFISYSSTDKAEAERICITLESAGMTCWIAPRNIPPGTDYPKAIVEAILAAQVLVLVLTDQAAASPNVASEVGHAFNGKKRIIPFRISQKPLPEELEYFLSLTQWLDAPEGGTESNLTRLVEAIRAALAGGPPAHVTSARASRPLWYAGAAFVLLAAGALLSLRIRQPHEPEIALPPPKDLKPPASEKLRTWQNPADGLNYAWIPSGTFTMGCSALDSECKDDEKPAHQVTLEKGFWLGQTEVTLNAYRKFVPKYSPPLPESDRNLPVLGVSWAASKDFCAAMGGRLPTEAEWEYAARAGNSQPYYGIINEIAWYAKNSGDGPHAVGQKQPNAFGLYDMLGNVAEWVLDRYFDQYPTGATTNGPGVLQPLAGNALAVARGGYWQNDAEGLRVSRRLAQEPDGAGVPIGFRCANDHQ